MNSVVVHYQEIALKGKNRPWFISRLVANVRAAVTGLDVQSVRALMGRLEVVLGPGAQYEDVRDRLQHVFGVANCSRAGRSGRGIEEMAQAVLADLGALEPGSFRVSVRRADKRYPMRSPEIEREVGGRIKQARGWKVELDHPELTVGIEILNDHAFYSFGKDKGPGGLPTGSSGRVACLLSGGIDSPVAAWRMMKRGCPVLLVHFHSYPFLSRASQEKVRELAEILTRYQQHSRLFLVAFGEIQRQVVLSVPAALRVVVYRRLMMRIADRIARDHGAGALVTGEVIGQVASQTLENMTIIGSVTTLPILRPLVGMDKEEIVAQAERLGSYEISIVPDQDCCQLFTPKHPATRARIEEVEAAERLLPIDELVAAAAAGAEIEKFTFPPVPESSRLD
ncbi:MAG TPA: tRNA uracil 4-sulfurtransferase ThiI [Vicinamibacterales bacterium]|nr:tRNA uracil 4-sulfurtransferase ThiI [Vicinamibacterales bacterium]